LNLPVEMAKRNFSQVTRGTIESCSEIHGPFDRTVLRVAGILLILSTPRRKKKLANRGPNGCADMMSDSACFDAELPASRQNVDAFTLKFTIF
jgi:hypothetical protein